MMTAQQIAQKVSSLSLPSDSYVVFGSCPMAAYGLRESSDIDMLITEPVHNLLTARGWQELPGREGDRRLENSEFDTHTNWKMGDYDPTVAELLSDAVWINGVPFASLDEVKKWKAIKGRPKDLDDIALIDAFLAGNN